LNQASDNIGAAADRISALVEPRNWLPHFLSSGRGMAICTLVPILPRAKRRAAASRWSRRHPWVCGAGWTKPREIHTRARTRTSRPSDTTVRFTLAAPMFFLVVIVKLPVGVAAPVCRRCLHRHEETIAFLVGFSHEEVLGRERKFDSTLEGSWGLCATTLYCGTMPCSSSSCRSSSATKRLARKARKRREKCLHSCGMETASCGFCQYGSHRFAFLEPFFESAAKYSRRTDMRPIAVPGDNANAYTSTSTARGSFVTTARSGPSTPGDLLNDASWANSSGDENDAVPVRQEAARNGH